MYIYLEKKNFKITPQPDKGFLILSRHKQFWFSTHLQAKQGIERVIYAH